MLLLVKVDGLTMILFKVVSKQMLLQIDLIQISFGQSGHSKQRMFLYQQKNYSLADTKGS
jgi:hypothetical protein